MSFLARRLSAIQGAIFLVLAGLSPLPYFVSDALRLRALWAPAIGVMISWIALLLVWAASDRTMRSCLRITGAHLGALVLLIIAGSLSFMGLVDFFWVPVGTGVCMLIVALVNFYAGWRSGDNEAALGS